MHWQCFMDKYIYNIHIYNIYMIYIIYIIYIIKIICYIYNKQIFYINIKEWLGENVYESVNQTLPLSLQL